jgi:hypothetical protein
LPTAFNELILVCVNLASFAIAGIAPQVAPQTQAGCGETSIDVLEQSNEGTQGI